MRFLNLCRPFGRMGSVLAMVFAVSGALLSPTPSLAEDPMNSVIPVVGAVVNAVNVVVCPGGICPKPPRVNPCDYIPGLPGECVTYPVGPCTVSPDDSTIPGTPIPQANCNNIDPDPCHYPPVSGIEGVCVPIVVGPCAIGGPGPLYPVPGNLQCGPVDPNPCHYYPVSGLPGVCGNPLPQVSSPSDLTSAQVALLIGNVNPDATVDQDLPQPTLSLLAGCQHFLDTFLADTQYLGYLYDYGNCVELGSVPAVMATLAKVHNNVKFVAGMCTIATSAFENANSTRIHVTGSFDCRNGVSQALVFGSQGVALSDFLRNGNASGGTFTSNGGVNWAQWDAEYAGGISKDGTGATRFDGGIGKVSMPLTTVTPTGQCTGANAVCQTTWVVLPNKSVNTGATLSCSSNPTSGALTCTAYGAPMTDSSISHHTGP